MANRQNILAGSAFLRLFLKDDATGELKKAMGTVGAGLKTAATAAIGFGASAAAALAGAAALFVKVGSDLKDMSDRTGVSTDALSEFGHAASMTGASLEDVEAAIRNIQKTLVDATDGSKGANEALAKLGLTADQLKTMKPEDQFATIAERIGAVADPTAKAALAMELFGKAGTKLIPMAGQLKGLREEARKLGLSITPEQAAAADALGDAWDRLKGVVMGFTLQIGAAVAPALTRLADLATSTLSGILPLVTELATGLSDITRAFIDVGTSATDTGKKVNTDLTGLFDGLITVIAEANKWAREFVVTLKIVEGSLAKINSLRHLANIGFISKGRKREQLSPEERKQVDEEGIAGFQALLDAKHADEAAAKAMMKIEADKDLPERIKKRVEEIRKAREEAARNAAKLPAPVPAPAAAPAAAAPAGGKGGVSLIGLAQLAAMAVRTLPSAKAKPGEISALPTLSGIAPIGVTHSAAAAIAQGYGAGRSQQQDIRTIAKHGGDTVKTLEKIVTKIETLAANLVFG